MAGGIKLAPLMTEIKLDVKNFKSDMEKAGAIGVKEAERISKSMSTTAKIGDIFTKTGTSLTKGLTVPIVGSGAAVTKMSVDFETSFAKVSTLLDSNVVDFEKYKNDILDASSKSKVAVDDFSESVYSSISAGVDQTKAIEFTTEAMKLAKGGFTTGAKSVDVLTTAINGYNLKADDATRISDLLITTQNLGKTTVDELASSMGAVIPVANSVNFGVEELSASYAQLTKNGIATAESGTYLKAMLSELGKSGSDTDLALRELTGKGFADLKKEGVATTDILSMLSQYAAENDKTLKDMFGSVEAGSAALVLAKGDGAEYNEMLRGMESSAGATQAAFEKMDATPAERMKGALNELKNEGIKFGDAFVPVIEKTADLLGDAADAFSGLSEEQQDNVIKWGMVLAAAGPTLKLLGGGVKTYTKLASVMGGVTKGLKEFGNAQKIAATAAKGTSAAVGHSGLTGSMIGLIGTYLPVAAGAAAVGAGLYAIHESGQLAKRQVNEASEEMSIMERICAKLSGTETHTRKELEKMGYVHEEFSEDISPEFQKAVEESTKKVQDFNVFLREIGFDDVISQEEGDEFNSRVNKACDEAIQTIKSKKDESQSALKELFVADDTVIDESEQRVLEILSASSEKQIAEVDQLRGEIIAIKQKAVDEARVLNEQEIADIEAKNERIRQIELESLGGTMEEVAYAKNEFNARVKTMDLESAAELMQEKATIRDDEIVKIQASYDTEIEMLKSSLHGKTAEERKAINEQITNLEKDRNDKIQIQKDLYEDYLKIIEENNPKLLEGINKFNGEVLTNEDIHSQQMLEKYSERYNGMSQITESGCYQMWNTMSNTYSEVAVVVDEKTGEIIGFHDKTNNLTAGYCESMAQSAKDMANDQSASFRQIISAEGAYVDYTTGQVCLANGTAIASLDELKESTDGTRKGIIDINGTPYEIKVNKDNTITSLREIGNEADYAARERTININTNYRESWQNSGSSYDKWAGNLYGNGSHYNGLDNVPYDGYRAVLHKGERVLTAEENKAYAKAPEIDYTKMERCMRNAVQELTMNVGNRELGRVFDNHLRERGLLA